MKSTIILDPRLDSLRRHQGFAPIRHRLGGMIVRKRKTVKGAAL